MQAKPHQTRTITDTLDPARAQALQATLGQTPTIQSGEALPPFAHHIYFWDALPLDALCEDGNPATGDFIPDLGLPRRIWAAGRAVHHQPLKAGIKAEKISTVEGVTRKDGQSGPLAFVRVRHDIKQRHALAITEWQELVYSPANIPTTEPVPSPKVATHTQPLTFTTTQLFRYAALTFNSHRIHYDADFARDSEGYAGLVVPAPLLAQLMMQLATQLYGGIPDFTYRSTSPLILGEAATLCANENHIWVRGEDGRLCASGHIAPR